MHPYEVEIYVRQRQHEIQLAFEHQRLVTEFRQSVPAWRGRMLWRLGSTLIGYGRCLCRASGISATTAEHESNGNLVLR